MVSLKFEDRGETIVYEDGGKVLRCDCTWHNAFRLFTDNITRWDGFSKPFDTEERLKVIKNILLKCKQNSKLILVISDKDKDSLIIENLIYDKDLWSLCIGIEYSGMESKRTKLEKQIEKSLQSGEKCEINGIEIKSLLDFRTVTEHMKFIDASESY